MCFVSDLLQYINKEEKNLVFNSIEKKKKKSTA